jgi:DNA polymerase (family 10)
MPISNNEIADILEEIGTLLELKGENVFKSRAFHAAARTLGSSTDDLPRLAEDNQLTTVKGIGKGLADIITDLLRNGSSRFHHELKQSFPPGVLALLKIPGLGPKRVKQLYETSGITSPEELRKAAGAHTIARMPGFGEKTEQNILASLDRLEKFAQSFLYAAAAKAAEQLLAAVRSERGVIRADIAGSLRRKKEIIGDIDIVASCKKGASEAIMDRFTASPEVDSIVARGETKASVVLKGGIPCDLRIVRDDEYPYALAYFTGSKEHNVAVRGRAKDFGLSLNEYGFSPAGKKKPKKLPVCRDEADIYKTLKLSYIPPELRENRGEMEAAESGALPTLIEEKDIRGTFHCHTTASDGRDTLTAMADAAIELGWEYLGIADHSKIAAYANGLTAERVKLQHKEIDILNRKFKNFRLFKGTEVDILSDGSLDWDAGTLARFDYVVASVHSKFTMTEEEATKRLIKAIKNKYVTMLGHATGRLLLQRDGYPVNMKSIIDAAADYGKMIEINADPLRLDLDWRWCHYAKERGVLICINPDAHSIAGLQNVRYGVGVARKGWLEAGDVFNTRRRVAVCSALSIKT